MVQVIIRSSDRGRVGCWGNRSALRSSHFAEYCVLEEQEILTTCTQVTHVPSYIPSRLLLLELTKIMQPVGRAQRLILIQTSA